MSSIARKIGKTLAYVQDTADVVLRYGFHKLNSRKPSPQAKQPKVKKVALKALGFFGEIGETFYQEYEKLKTKRVKK